MILLWISGILFCGLIWIDLNQMHFAHDVSLK
jgi:hypothetical protein